VMKKEKHFLPSFLSLPLLPSSSCHPLFISPIYLLLNPKLKLKKKKKKLLLRKKLRIQILYAIII